MQVHLVLQYHNLQEQKCYQKDRKTWLKVIVFYIMSFYTCKRTSSSKIKIKHFTEIKVIIPHQSFSKTLKELDEAFGGVGDLNGVLG